jgi:hypothetical protein
MKKIGIIFGISSLLFGLSGCMPSIFDKEDHIVFENENKTVQLVIGYLTSYGPGRLNIFKDDVLNSFVIDYIDYFGSMEVYLNLENDEESYFLDVSFEQVHYFKMNYDIMYLKDDLGRNDKQHEILTGFDVKLTRNYTAEISPLDYFRNRWASEEANFIFINDNLMMYEKYSMYGTLDEDEVTISFLENSFIILDSDQTMILSGSYFFAGKDIILEKLESYEDFPDHIFLVFKGVSYMLEPKW